MYTADNVPKIFYRTQFQDQITEKIFLNYFLLLLFCVFPLEKNIPTNKWYKALYSRKMC